MTIETLEIPKEKVETVVHDPFTREVALKSAVETLDELYKLALVDPLSRRNMRETLLNGSEDTPRTRRMVAQTITAAQDVATIDKSTKAYVQYRAKRRLNDEAAQQRAQLPGAGYSKDKLFSAVSGRVQPRPVFVSSKIVGRR
jgi:hypothetical protein